jgi:hypothetical protein
MMVKESELLSILISKEVAKAVCQTTSKSRIVIPIIRVKRNVQEHAGSRTLGKRQPVDLVYTGFTSASMSLDD